jgi:hypothetical protein
VNPLRQLRRFERWLFIEKQWGLRPGISWIFSDVDKHGVEFPYRGDHIIWLWPWRRQGKPKYVSVGFSGNGDFGDASFFTLKEIDKRWDDFETACAKPLETLDL